MAKPYFTIFLAASAVILAILETQGVVTYDSVRFSWRYCQQHGEWYRLFTAMLYRGPLNASLLEDLYFLMANVSKLETGRFAGSFGRFGVFYLILALSLAVSSYWFPLPNFKYSLDISLLYFWMSTSPNVVVIFLGLPLSARLYFIAQTVLLFVRKAYITQLFLGVLFGHIYFWATNVLSHIWGKESWLMRLEIKAGNAVDRVIGINQ